jgi:putative hemolysin
MNWTETAIILGLILLNGVFAGSELALVSARKARLRARADRGHRGAKVALQLLETPTRLLSTAQIGITLIGIFTGVYSGAVFATHLAVILRRFPLLAPYSEEAAFVIIVVVVTYFSLIFGELVPKRIALAHAERLAELVSIPMLWLSRIAFPLVSLLQVSTDAVTKLLPLQTAPQASLLEDELRALVAAGTREGVFHRREKEMIEGVLRLADRSVESIMVPRGDVIWLDLRAPLDELWKQARASGHSQYLLCEGELEQMVGVITLADLGEALRLNRLDPEQHVRPALHVPESVSVLRLMELFSEAKVHLAVVTSEYGEILGLATPADVLKAIAGEMALLDNRERAEAVRREDGSWLMDGQLSIHEAERLLERSDLAHGEDYYTIAGFVLWNLGRLPAEGESLTWHDLRVEVVDMDGPRIDKVLVIPAKSQSLHAVPRAGAPSGSSA